MTDRGHDDLERQVDGWLAGIDGPRPLPDEIKRSLEDLLTGADPVGALVPAGVDGPRPIADEADRRLVGVLAGAATSAQAAHPSRWRRRLRVLPGGSSPVLIKAVAVAAAVVLVAGTVSLAAELTGRRSGGGPVDVVLPPREAPGPTVAPPASTTTAAPEPTPTELVAAADCDDLLDHFRTQALAAVDQGRAGVWSQQAWGGGRAVAVAGTAGTATAGDRAGPPASAPPPAAQGSAFAEASGTNVQEAGVDEPDIVKVERDRVFTVATDTRGPVIRSLRPTANGVDLLGTFDLPREAHDAQLLLHGKRLLALSTVWDEPTAGARPHLQVPGRTWTKVWVLDVSDPARMALTHTVAIEGSYTTARLVDGLVRVVVAGGVTGPPVAHPTDGTPQAAERAKQGNARAVRSTTLDDWVANYELSTYRNGREVATETGRACACEDTLRPKAFGGFNTVTVLTIDPADPKPDNVASVTGAAGIAYASPTDLFVASNPFSAFSPVALAADATIAPPPGGPGAPRVPQETSIHQFSITEPTARYVASGKVPGSLLSQFSMSQHDGHLRVASTLSDSQREQGIDNVVSVLRREGPDLTVVGQVAGLGEPGERIQGVRMMGDTGYVVTFRQTDPLYVLDLATPTKPRVLGELKIPGVSTYLHPMGSSSLIGIGAEATDEGRRTGVGMSVFDVRDRSKPTRAAHLVLGPGQSDAERNHHAFLYWPRTSTVVVPYAGWWSNGQRSPEFSAVVVRATPTELRELGRVSHLGRDEPTTRSGHGGLAMIQRSAVIDGRLWTFSSVGVLINDLSSLREQAWLSYFGR